MRHIEENTQILCVKWFTMQYRQLADRLHHSPNGGRRDKREAGRFKAMGVKAGYPDLVLHKSSNGYVGLAIEMKTSTGKQTDTQKRWQEILTEEGWLYVVCRNFEEFKSIVWLYLHPLPNK